MNRQPKQIGRPRNVAFCPIHGLASDTCWQGCLPERLAFKKASSALRSYFWQLEHRVVVLRRRTCAWCWAVFQTPRQDKHHCCHAHAVLDWHARHRAA